MDALGHLPAGGPAEEPDAARLEAREVQVEGDPVLQVLLALAPEGLLGCQAGFGLVEAAVGAGDEDLPVVEGTAFARVQVEAVEGAQVAVELDPDLLLLVLRHVAELELAVDHVVLIGRKRLAVQVDRLDLVLLEGPDLAVVVGQLQLEPRLGEQGVEVVGGEVLEGVAAGEREGDRPDAQ
ncbi:hypothetical protein D3C86_1554130 [compost metagenome]